ncbi:hypothetical protein KCP69_08070 [Salmonella enterica subsp. enterica]|nr:hypothetical protein KCP69_08070 [Salmonella enterica subsp. enterica]
MTLLSKALPGKRGLLHRFWRQHYWYTDYDYAAAIACWRGELRCPGGFSSVSLGGLSPLAREHSAEVNPLAYRRFAYTLAREHLSAC